MSEYQIQNGDPKCVRGRRLGGLLGRLFPLPLQTLRPRDQSKGPQQGWAPCDPHRVFPAQEVVAALKKEKEEKKETSIRNNHIVQKRKSSPEWVILSQ